MTKLSHIPMQIQKWIASLAHLFFLILGLIGISLMYINGNFGLGLTGIGSVPYEDTAEFNTQFNNDLNDIFLYMEYQDVFGADSSIDLSRRMLKMTFGPSAWLLLQAALPDIPGHAHAAAFGAAFNFFLFFLAQPELKPCVIFLHKPPCF